MFYNQKAIAKGIWNIKDFCDHDLTLLPHTKFQEKYPDALNWLDYECLVKSIPKRWSEMLRVSNQGQGVQSQ